MTRAMAQRRVRAHQKAEENAAAREELGWGPDAEQRTLVPSEVYKEMRWDVEPQDADGGVWGACLCGGRMGYEHVMDEGLMHEPLERVFMRWDSFETEPGKPFRRTVRTDDGVEVGLDREEVAALGRPSSGGENVKVATAAVPLHLQHFFTDVWAVDGSKGEHQWRAGGETKVETRVACGAYEGIMPLRREPGESDDEVVARRVAA